MTEDEDEATERARDELIENVIQRDFPTVTFKILRPRDERVIEEVATEISRAIAGILMSRRRAGKALSFTFRVLQRCEAHLLKMGQGADPMICERMFPHTGKHRSGLVRWKS